MIREATARLNAESEQKTAEAELEVGSLEEYR